PYPRLAHLLLEALERARDSPADGPDRDLQHLTDLFVGVALQKGKGEDMAILHTELRQGVVDRVSLERRYQTSPRTLGAGHTDRLERQLERTLSGPKLSYYREGVFRFDPALNDLDTRWRRLDLIDDYAQVLVLAVPPLEEVGVPNVAAEFAKLANDEMADLVSKHRDRFVGFAAALPLNDIDASVAEMDRAVAKLGALGVQVFTNVLGVALDDARFEPIWTRIEELDRTVWLHPTR